MACGAVLKTTIFPFNDSIGVFGVYNKHMGVWEIRAIDEKGKWLPMFTEIFAACRTISLIRNETPLNGPSGSPASISFLT